MNRQLVCDAVNNLRKVAKKATYRQLLPKDMVEVEAYLQQILVEIDTPDTMWDMIKKSLRELK